MSTEITVDEYVAKFGGEDPQGIWERLGKPVEWEKWFSGYHVLNLIEGGVIGSVRDSIRFRRYIRQIGMDAELEPLVRALEGHIGGWGAYVAYVKRAPDVICRMVAQDLYEQITGTGSIHVSRSYVHNGRN